MNKPLFCLLITSMYAVPSWGQTPCFTTPIIPPDPGGYVSIHIQEFGAIADDGWNDQRCFNAAADWFNARGGNGELVFGKGVYIVGEQLTNVPGVYRAGVDPLKFNGCTNLHLVGSGHDTEDRTVIRFDDCLRFGTFDPVTGSRLLVPRTINCVYAGPGFYYQAAWLGSIISFTDCRDVSVSKMELNGNATDLIVGGKWGETGIQLAADGINIYNTFIVQVKQVLAHQFGRDGLWVSASDNYAMGANMQIKLVESKFNWNGRNGFSWTGGSGLYAVETDFDYNGAGYIRSAPGAGVDIELDDNTTYAIENGVFEDCNFRYNQRWGFITDYGDACHACDSYFNVPVCAWKIAKVAHHDFIGCTLVGSDVGQALRACGRDMEFTGCRIYGGVSRVFNTCATNDPTDRTRFEDCYFSDVYDGECISKFASGMMIDTFNGGGIELDGCSMEFYGCKWSMMQLAAVDTHYGYISNGLHIKYHGLVGCFAVAITRYLCSPIDITVEVAPVCYSSWLGNGFIVYNSDQCGLTPCSPYRYTCYVSDYQAVNYATMLPPAYTNPIVPIPVAISCAMPGVTPCFGNPNSSCGAYHQFMCCDPDCGCYLLEPVETDCTDCAEDNRMKVAEGDCITLIPNPARNNVMVKLGATMDDDEYVLEVRSSMDSRLILTEVMRGDRKQMDVSGLASGVYHVRVGSASSWCDARLVVE